MYKATSIHTFTEYTDVKDDRLVPRVFHVTDVNGKAVGFVRFQDGPAGEVGVNGVTNEDLLHMVKVRLEAFQKSRFAHPENALALENVTCAIDALFRRVEEWQARRVEGASKV